MLVTRDELPKSINASCCYNNLPANPNLSFMEVNAETMFEGDMRFKQKEIEEEALSVVARKFVKKINELRSRSDQERMSNFNTYFKKNFREAT